MKCENCNKEHGGSYGSGRFCSKSCRMSFISKCRNNKTYTPHLNKRAKYGTWKCCICDTIFETRAGLTKHKHEQNHFEQFNGWNKGLTKNTDSRVRKQGETYSYKVKTGSIQPSFKNRKHSENSKVLMRKKALESPHQRICKKTVSYYNKWMDKIVKLDSSYEVIMAKLFDENNIEWIRPNPIKWIDKNKIIHNYFPDFYLVKYNLFVDPKNDYCFKAQSEKLKCLKCQYSNIIFLTKDQLNLEFLSGYASTDEELSSKQLYGGSSPSSLANFTRHS